MLIGYVVFAFAAVGLLSFKPQLWTISPLVTHLVDVSMAAALTLVTLTPGAPFYVMFMFTLLAAAHRWGFRQTVATAAVVVMLLVFQSVLVASVPPVRLIMRSMSLLLAGVVTGYLVQTQKQSRTEAVSIANTMSRADVRVGLKRTMSEVFDAIFKLFDPNRALLVVHEVASDQVYMWDVRRSSEGSVPSVRVSEIASDRLPTYMFAPSAGAWHAVRRNGSRGERLDVVALDREGTRFDPEPWVIPAGFITAVQPFNQLMALGVELGAEMTGRVFLIDPHIGADREGVLGFSQRVIRQVGPSVYNVYLLQRLRWRAAAVERARLWRELHDGIIQTVMGVQIQLAALSFRVAKESPGVASELTRLDGILRLEVTSLRELMQQMKPIDLGPDQLVDALADVVEQFQRETGIAARFVTQLDRVALRPRACIEVARIVQEALVNVRKHSGARNVLVRFAAVDGQCTLSIDDDGRGFPFAGRRSQTDLEAAREGPWVIRERVRLLGGKLTLESAPGHGSRLEIAVPLASHGIQG